MLARYLSAGLTAILVVACGGSKNGDGHGSSSGGAAGDVGGVTGGRDTGGNGTSAGGATSSGGSGGGAETGDQPGSAGGGAAGFAAAGGSLGGGGVVAGGTGAMGGDSTGGTSSPPGGAGAGAPASNGGAGGVADPGAGGSAQGGFAGDPISGGPGGVAGSPVGQPGGTAGARANQPGGTAGAAGGGPRPATCGGFAGVGCGSDRQYCRYEVGTCNVTDRVGECAIIPDLCVASWNPVCGCDGVTYANACEAERATMSIAHAGRCTSGEAAVCGGFAGTRCPEGTVCVFPMGRCAATDLGGQCVQPPEACPAERDPVCSCQGDTYANECEAVVQQSGPLDHAGACR
jgi:hypothetical protein